MPKLYPGYRDEIRRKIVDQAFTIFLAKGFEKTTMDDIAAQLGVTKPAIYRYYKSKEELFLASVAETMAAEFKKIFNTSFAANDLMTGADRFFDELLKFDRKYAAIKRDLDNIMSQNAAPPEYAVRLHGEGLELMRKFFDEHRKRGTINTMIDNDDLITICSALAHGLTSNVGFGLDPIEAKRLWLQGFAQLANVRTGKKQ